MIPVELFADQLATMVKLVALISALPAATQATASSLPNNQHHCNTNKIMHVSAKNLTISQSRIKVNHITRVCRDLHQRYAIYLFIRGVPFFLEARMRHKSESKETGQK